MSESENRALNVMRLAIHTGLKMTPFELHRCRKLRANLTNIIKSGKSFLSNWLDFSANDQSKIPIYVLKVGDGEVSNHIIMARRKTKKKHKLKSHRKRECRLVITLFNSSKRTITRNDLKVDFRINNKRQ